MPLVCSCTCIARPGQCSCLGYCQCRVFTGLEIALTLRVFSKRLFAGLDSARVLGVEPLLTAEEIAEEDEEHLGVMSYAARFLNLKPQAMSAFTKYEPDKVQSSQIVYLDIGTKKT